MAGESVGMPQNLEQILFVKHLTWIGIDWAGPLPAVGQLGLERLRYLGGGQLVAPQCLQLI